MTYDQTAKVINHLSAIISAEMRALASEYWTPQCGPDRSESEMNFRKRRISELRKMRADFESIMAAVPPEEV